MRTLTWLPKQLREDLAAIDPAREVTPDRPAFVAPTDMPLDIGGRRIEPSRRSRFALATSFVLAALVVAAAVGLVVLWGPSGPAAHLGSGRAGVATGDPADAKLAADFPVTADPRPLVVIGESVQAGGFPDGDTKEAFIDGAIDLATRLPTAPGRRDGYPVMPAAAAVRQLTDVHACCGAPRTRLRITAATLVDQTFVTDRGTRRLPAWRFRFAAVPEAVYVLAVAVSARYPERLEGVDASAGTAGVSDGGRQLTVSFVASEHSDDPCHPSFTSTMSVTQTRTAIHVDIDVTSTPSRSTPTDLACPAVGYALALNPDPRPGDPNTKTITLDSPLGNRVVVDRMNRPYEVVAG